MGKHENVKQKRKLRKQKRRKKRSILNRGRKFCNIDIECNSTNASNNTSVPLPYGVRYMDQRKHNIKTDQIIKDYNKFENQGQNVKRDAMSDKYRITEKQAYFQHQKKKNCKNQRKTIVNDPLYIRLVEYQNLKRRISHIEEEKLNRLST